MHDQKRERLPTTFPLQTCYKTWKLLLLWPQFLLQSLHYRYFLTAMYHFNKQHHFSVLSFYPNFGTDDSNTCNQGGRVITGKTAKHFLMKCCEGTWFEKDVVACVNISHQKTWHCNEGSTYKSRQRGTTCPPLLWQTSLLTCASEGKILLLISGSIILAYLSLFLFHSASLFSVTSLYFPLACTPIRQPTHTHIDPVYN